MSLDGRIRLAVRREGTSGALHMIARRAARPLICSEDHVWYACDLTAERPRVPLAAGQELRRVGEGESEVLEQIPNVTARECRRRIRSGHDVWAVLDEGRVLFSCTIFRGEAPAVAGAGGRVRLAPETVCLEDSMTAPDARRREIASTAVLSVLQALTAQGARWVITKVAVDNVPTRRGAEKLGFEGVAVMHLRRTGPRSRTWLDEVNGAGAHTILSQIEEGLGITSRRERRRAAPQGRPVAEQPHA
jgi:RimJ/RimL family protein N-acetyltransferase